MSVCGVKRKYDKLSIKETFVSYSNPKFVESFLRENLEIEVDISYNDLLCFSCYKYCNRLLKSGTSDGYSQLLTETKY